MTVTRRQCFRLRRKVGRREAVAAVSVFMELLRSLQKWHIGYRYSIQRR